MKTEDVAVTRLAARQYSLAHRDQALKLGLTPRQIQARVESGWLTPVHRDVYRLAGGHSSAEQAVLAACLSAGPKAAASHRSAGVLWGLRGVVEKAPEITVVGDRHRRMAGVVVHRTDTLDPVDISHRARIPVTTPARTLLDLGAVVPVEAVESALEDALMRRLVWHGGRTDVQRNSHKANVLVAHGWRVLRFTWSDVRRRPAYVVDAVARELVLAWPA